MGSGCSQGRRGWAGRGGSRQLGRSGQQRGGGLVGAHWSMLNGGADEADRKRQQVKGVPRPPKAPRPCKQPPLCEGGCSWQRWAEQEAPWAQHRSLQWVCPLGSRPEIRQQPGRDSSDPRRIPSVWEIFPFPKCPNLLSFLSQQNTMQRRSRVDYPPGSICSVFLLLPSFPTALGHAVHGPRGGMK